MSRVSGILPRFNARAPAIAGGIFIGFLALCFLGGGASRGDVLSLVYLRPAAVLAIAAFLLLPLERDWQTYRVPVALLGAFAALIAFQLVPLPANVWLSLPGRAAFEPAATAAGLAQPWRPLSLTPERTLQSLVTLLFPFAALIGMATIGRERSRRLLPILIGAILLSAVLGILQLTAGEASPFHFYNITHRGSAVGLFANRNHQAALLAICIPILRVWTLLPSQDSQYRRTRQWLAIAVCLFLVAMILVTGSRAGLVLGFLGFVAAWLVSPIGIQGARNWAPLAKLALVVVPLLTAISVFALGRATAIQRLLQDDTLESEARLELLPAMLDVVRTYFPVGTGFGAFDPAFRAIEPDNALSTQYLNHAHNEIVELAVTGGVPALLLLAAFLAWFARSSVWVFRGKAKGSTSRLVGRLGSVIVFILLVGSVVDYPLRTPLLAVIFTIACCWLAQARAERKLA
jgi:O-antigen ligase